MAAAQQQGFYELYRGTSIGIALADTLDDLISSRRIEPQLAMRIMSNFDQSIAQVLNEKVKARVSFKVSGYLRGRGSHHEITRILNVVILSCRVILTSTVSVTKSGHS
jgi:hypothetical protein